MDREVWSCPSQKLVQEKRCQKVSLEVLGIEHLVDYQTHSTDQEKLRGKAKVRDSQGSLHGMDHGEVLQKSPVSMTGSFAK